MGNLFNVDNVVWRTMGKMVDVCILTILWLICCIPIAAFCLLILLPNLGNLSVLTILIALIGFAVCSIPVGPASTAVYYVTLKLVRDEESYTFRSFVKSFKQNFKQGAVIGIIMTLLAVFFLYDIYAYFHIGTQVTQIVAIIFIGIFVIYLFVVTYVYPLLAKFYNTNARTMRNALFISVRHLFRSLLMIVVAVAVWVGCLFFPPLLLLSYGLIAFIQSFFLVRIFDLYTPKEEDEKKNEDLFMTNAEIENRKDDGDVNSEPRIVENSDDGVKRYFGSTSDENVPRTVLTMDDMSPETATNHVVLTMDDVPADDPDPDKHVILTSDDKKNGSSSV